MLAKIPTNAQLIILAIAELSHTRKEDKRVYINADSISKKTGLTWKTVDKYLTNKFNIKELK